MEKDGGAEREREEERIAEDEEGTRRGERKTEDEGEEGGARSEGSQRQCDVQ